MISLTKTKNNRGPKIAPCGTPHEIFTYFKARFATSRVK